MMNFHKEYKNSFDSTYLSTGYYLPSGSIAATTSIQTPNQISELAQRLNLGVKNVEISGPLQPEEFQRVPKQHFEELKRAATLSDASLTLHAPMIDIVGFSRQTNAWSEGERKRSEEFLKDVLKKAAQMDAKGNIPVTVHTNADVPAYFWEKEIEAMPGGRLPPGVRTLYAVDQESGRIAPMEYEKKEYLTGTKIWYPEERLRSYNNTSWDEEKLKLLSLRKEAEETMEKKIRHQPKFIELHDFVEKGVATPAQVAKFHQLSNQMHLWDKYIEENNDRISFALQEMHHKYAQYADKTDERYLLVEKRLGALKNDFIARAKQSAMLWEEMQQRLRQAQSEQERQEISNTYNPRILELNRVNTEEALVGLADIPAPEVLIPVDDFAKKKASDTVANAALYAYENLGGEKAPTLAVENWHPETVLSRGSNFREFLDESRRKLSVKLQEKGLSDDAAKRTAEKLIGATWDVSHINMLKRFGYKDEEIAREIEAIAKPGLVKKIHLADNFGFADTHLVPGMGDAPIAEQLKILEKYGALEGAQQVLEAGAFDVQFKESSLPYALEAFNSPLYTHVMEPRWPSIRDRYGSYEFGFGDTLPELHFSSIYGAGFSNLPKELGGQISTDRSRFSGTPNE